MLAWQCPVPPYLEGEIFPGRGSGVCRARAALRMLLSQHPDDLRSNSFEIDTEALENPGRDALSLANQAEEDVLGADDVVLEAARFITRQLQYHPSCWRDPHVAHDLALAATDDELDGAADFRELDAYI